MKSPLESCIIYATIFAALPLSFSLKKKEKEKDARFWLPSLSASSIFLSDGDNEREGALEN